MNDESSLTPAKIVAELDRYVVGQGDAKRAVAVAMRNRWRRQQVVGELREEISPKNIIMMGPTGVGKTEIARRLAKLARAPFLKVEASKFTEVGYVGRDVDSIVRDLMEVSVKLVRDEEALKVRGRAKDAAEERVLDLLLPRGKSFTDRPGEPSTPSIDASREKLRAMLRDGKLDDREVEVELADDANPLMSVLGGQPGIDESALSGLKDMLGSFGRKTKRQKLKVPVAWRALTEQEVDKLIDHEAATREAINRAENAGIVFIDEIDKIATKAERHGGDVSREGVQRDLLPLVEGSTVSTKYGPIKTDHMLFIASGAFSLASCTASISAASSFLVGRIATCAFLWRNAKVSASTSSAMAEMNWLKRHLRSRRSDRRNSAKSASLASMVSNASSSAIRLSIRLRWVR